MKRIICSLLIAGIFAFAASSLSAQEVRIDRFVIGTGGMVGTVNDDNITMSGVTGQIAIENFPNPFSNSTIVKYNLPSSGYVNIKIYDLVGNVIKTLYNGYQNMGDQELSWNGKDEDGGNLSSGSYLYELTFSPTSNSKAYSLRNIMVILR